MKIASFRDSSNHNFYHQLDKFLNKDGVDGKDTTILNWNNRTGDW